MPVIVVLSDCPPKLRGDMSKWFFEVNTGVYVGNFSARVRENLWARITEHIGRGRATMVYSAPGEQRLDFRVHNAYWEPVDYDGIKLMRRPEKITAGHAPKDVQPGFSNAAKHRMAAYAPKIKNYNAYLTPIYVVLDIETTGLDEQADEIIEIAALLVENGEVVEQLQTLVRCQQPVPAAITQLTGITDAALQEGGKPLPEALRELLEFAEEIPVVCHNALFEQTFLQAACRRTGIERMENRLIDTLPLSRQLLPELESHKLSALVEYFGLSSTGLHRALADCYAANGIYSKLIELMTSVERKNE